MPDDADTEILEDDAGALPLADMDVLRAALETRALKECWVCGERDWSLPEGTNLVHAGRGAELEIDPATGFEVVTLICKRCGLVRMHHVGRLLDG